MNAKQKKPYKQNKKLFYFIQNSKEIHQWLGVTGSNGIIFLAVEKQ